MVDPFCPSGPAGMNESNAAQSFREADQQEPASQ